jgi:hypothetical protein
MSLILFFFSYFLDRVTCFCLGLAVDCNHPTFASWGAGTTDLYTIPNIVEMEVSLTFAYYGLKLWSSWSLPPT